MFHEHLLLIRKMAKRTQGELANYLNISAQSVSKWEKGDALPSIEFLPKMAEFFGCSINAFFSKFELETYMKIEPFDDKQVLDFALLALIEKKSEIEIDERKGDDNDDYPLESLFVPALYEYLQNNDSFTFRSLQTSLFVGYSVASQIVDALMKMGIATRQSDGVCKVNKNKVALLLPYMK